MLQFDQIALRRGPRLLFEDASFQIHPGQKVGVTGANGCGKSSLFSMVRGDLSVDSGRFHKPGGWTIAHVAQEMPEASSRAIDYVLDGDTELRRLQAALHHAEQQADGEQIAHLHAELEHAGAWQANSRAAQLLHGLGFGSTDEQRPVSEFSGGWRMRLNLAQALMCRSDLLLLDEPTNHLDLDAVIWLENWLRQYPGTLLLISHDREFLDAVCDHILHIELGGARLYSGNYSTFEQVRSEQLACQQAAYAKQQREIEHMHSFVTRFRAKATKAKQAQSRLKALQRMEVIAPAHVDSPFHFAFRQPDKNPSPLLRLDNATVGYDAVPIVSVAKLTLAPGDRIGLLGPNGAGKSTLIRLLAGELAPITGERHTAKDLTLGYFAQHQLQQLRIDQSPLQHLQRLDRSASEQALRDFLGGFGFLGDKALDPVGPFSGGEKSRLVLAILVYQRPNLLLLDEPTNHLDLEMRQALAQALQEFEGAMIIVSHDRHLLSVSCDTLLLVADGQVKEFSDALDDYPAWLAKRQKQPVAAEQARDTANSESAEARRQRKRQEAERRQQLAPLRKTASDAEARIEQLTTELEDVDARLADGALYTEDAKDKLASLLQKKATLSAAISSAEQVWLDAAEKLEQAGG